MGRRGYSPAHPTRESRESRKLPQQSLGQSPARNAFWRIFNVRHIPEGTESR